MLRAMPHAQAGARAVVASLRLGGANSAYAVAAQGIAACASAGHAIAATRTITSTS